MDGEITVTFDGNGVPRLSSQGTTGWNLAMDSLLKVDSTDRIVRSKHSAANQSERAIVGPWLHVSENGA